MLLRPLLSPLACCLLALSCAGRGTADGSATNDAGAPAALEPALLLPPATAASSPAELGPSPVTCRGTPAAPPALVRSCLLLGGCSPSPVQAAVSECIELALPESGLFSECVLGAQSCAELNACLGSGVYADPCPAGQEGAMCLGSKVVSCPYVGPRYYVDCEKTGASCVPYTLDDENFAGCAVSPSCSTPSDIYQCQGTKRVSCQQGIGFGEDCAARGLACVDAPDGASCVKVPATCAEPGVGVCDSDGKASFCQADGQALALDCSQLGFGCREAPERSHGIACVNPDCPAADAAACSEECDGPTAHLCLGGQRFSVDCRHYGFRACMLETLAGSGDRARCGDY